MLVNTSTLNLGLHFSICSLQPFCHSQALAFKLQPKMLLLNNNEILLTLRIILQPFAKYNFQSNFFIVILTQQKKLLKSFNLSVWLGCNFSHASPSEHSNRWMIMIIWTRSGLDHHNILRVVLSPELQHPSQSCHNQTYHPSTDHVEVVLCAT